MAVVAGDRLHAASVVVDDDARDMAEVPDHVREVDPAGLGDRASWPASVGGRQADLGTEGSTPTARPSPPYSMTMSGAISTHS